LLLEVEREHDAGDAGGAGSAGGAPPAAGRELVSALGEKGLRAELVARRACDELAAFLDANVPVGEYLADQLVLPLAVAGGGRFRTMPLSRHTTTNIDTVGRFLDVAIRVERDGNATVVIFG